MIENGEFIETAEFSGNLYGTSKMAVQVRLLLFHRPSDALHRMSSLKTKSASWTLKRRFFSARKSLFNKNLLSV